MTAQSRLPLLLLTRPLAQSEQFADSLPTDLRDRLDIAYAPLMRIQALDPGRVTGFSGYILTSANAVAALVGADVDGVPAYCVGQRTADAARAHGMTARSFDGDADDLVAGLTALAPSGPLLHLHGAHSRGAVAERLTQAGLSVQSRIVYDQVAQSLPQDLVDRLQSGQRAIAPLFSPRTARLFAAQCQQALQTDVICLSQSVAADLNPQTYRGIHLCDAPDGAAMAQAISRVVLAYRLEGTPLSV